MLGGAIKRPSTEKTVLVHHSEEVVVKTAGVVPCPTDRFTGKKLFPKGTSTHPMKLINLGTKDNIKGYRTQITSGEFGETGAAITFNNAAAGVTSQSPEVGDHIRIFWVEEVDGTESNISAVEVTISPDTFPGTYKVVGDTFMRSEKTGSDEPFQFIINKAKQNLAA